MREVQRQLNFPGVAVLTAGAQREAARRKLDLYASEEDKEAALLVGCCGVARNRACSSAAQLLTLPDSSAHSPALACTGTCD